MSAKNVKSAQHTRNKISFICRQHSNRYSYF